MKTFVLDANVCLRFLLADDPAQSPQARELFARAEAGAVVLRLSHVAIAELVWVLGWHFDFPRREVGTRLRGLVLHKGVEVEAQSLVLEALELFSRVNADFPDCYAAAEGARRGLAVASYDKDFRKFPGVTTQTPGEILKGKCLLPESEA